MTSFLTVYCLRTWQTYLATRQEALIHSGKAKYYLRVVLLFGILGFSFYFCRRQIVTIYRLPMGRAYNLNTAILHTWRVDLPPRWRCYWPHPHLTADFSCKLRGLQLHKSAHCTRKYIYSWHSQHWPGLLNPACGGWSDLILDSGEYNPAVKTTESSLSLSSTDRGRPDKGLGGSLCFTPSAAQVSCKRS